MIIPAEGRGAFLRRPGRFTGRIRGRSNHSRTGLDSGDAEPQEGGPVPRRVPYQTRLPDKKLLQAKLHEFYALAQSQADADARIDAAPLRAARSPTRAKNRKAPKKP